MEELKEKISQLVKNPKCDSKIIDSIKEQKSIHPFSTESRLLAYLLFINVINYKEYTEISSDFCQRIQQKNQYISLFDMSPRTFGQTWGEQHIKQLFPDFEQATKKNLKNKLPSFDGEFDLWIDNIRVEVKACRANSTASKGSLSSRAYTHAEAKKESFKYHYQQLKPSCCDVFIWIGVCKDDLIYWVLTSDELQKTGKLVSQHRNENTGVTGAEVFEGQVFMTEDDLKQFLVNEKDILSEVKNKMKKR